MKIEFHPVGEIKIAEILSDDILIREVQDALDLMADCRYQGAWRIILYENNIVPDFFELHTGLAGEILQKFSNYQVKLAIIGNFSKYSSMSLKDFIFESKRQRHVNFVRTLDEAMKALSGI
jgi:hypothetical protein